MSGIRGVRVRPLKVIPDERGRIMHMLRRDDPWCVSFGEIYFSAVYPGAIKAWHLHKRMTLNYAVPVGMITLVLYDDRQGSATRGRLMELVLGEAAYTLVTVPPGVWNGFTGVSPHEAIVANCATEPHDPEEIVRMDPFTSAIPYEWRRRT